MNLSMRLPLVALFLSVGLLFGQAKKPAKKTSTPAVAAEAPGPWILGTVGVGKRADGTIESTGYKGLALKLGAEGKFAIAYDLELCRPLGGWSGKFTTEMNLMSRGDYPTAMGETIFAVTGDVAGFEPGVDAKELTARKGYGPLAQGKVRFKGFHNAGNKVVLTWDVGGVLVYETSEVAKVSQHEFIVRTIEVSPSKSGVTILAPLSYAQSHITAVVTSSAGSNQTAKLGDRDVLRVAPASTPTLVRIAYVPEGSVAQIAGTPSTEIPSALLAKTDRLWPQTVETKGELSTKKDEAYVVDKINLPETNPWKAPLFTSALDFLPDGRAVVSTFHGDVFIASGIDDKLEKITWRRFASGLYHPLGLKVVKGEIYVTCRDGIWRLHDSDGDGECDTYEAFNFDVMVTMSFHEFVFDLQTDPEGNFYFIKAGPVRKGGRGFDDICDHHGSLFKVSPDGKKFEVIATGFRAPNGIGISPTGQITTGDNEGTWTPVCRLNWVKQGGFYGVPPLAHRSTEPADYDRPLCWLPKDVDNSSGGQVWVTSDKFGPWKDRLLHLSYGTCSLYGVMPQPVTLKDEAIMQGGVARFNVNFDSGIMRARFNPQDGQLYVTGLRGWQTTATHNGCLQRVRYTGHPADMPLGLKVTRQGVQIDFSDELDPKFVADVTSWNIEIWNYVWSSAYGSPDISTVETKAAATELGNDGKMQFSKEQMAQRKHDTLVVKSAKLLPGRKSVLLEVADLRPAMQMLLKYDLKTLEGKDVSGQIVNTIHVLPE